MEQNPVATLQQVIGGYVVARCLHAAANLGIADALGETPLSAAEIAAVVGAHPEALDRVLRLLTAYGIFQRQDDRYSHTPASRLLRTDHPQSLNAFVRMFASPINWATYQELEYSLKTGMSASEKVVPEGMWAYRAAHPEENKLFNQSMAARARRNITGVTASYDFSPFPVIGDIGGGHGHLIQAILDCTPGVKGVLFDQPHVVNEVGDVASDRLTIQAGDFFNSDLPACDAYLLMSIIHDWDDDAARAILTAIRKSAPPHAKLLLIETMIPDDPGPDWAKILDIHMLTLLGGKQRTRQEYEVLLNQAGFGFLREIDTGAGVSILEAAAR